ncbi:M28 family metallopeptidase [Pedobacter faecalis]|uniref:M28 family metallopeptidase n=1 Tax=Pedobacter faecalis TaxID=3041495 RepID=UPI00254F56DA|nr:M20/M25/M40 family metallo-hydrolase [Pedobacter sp. ELA7]
MKSLACIVFILLTGLCRAQDPDGVKHTVAELSSAAMWGRGYTKGGMARAADYITEMLKRHGLQAVDSTYRQTCTFPVNTFPGKMEMSVDGRRLVPGRDFIVHPASRGLTASGKLVQTDSLTFINPENRIALVLKDKLTWSVSQELADYTALEVKKSAAGLDPKEVSVDIENMFIPEFKADNICALVKGTRRPDSLIVLTAHYDHLGGMGSDTFFPGANDNASGVAFLLSLAGYYAKHPQPYTIMFIFFAAEEAGLVGSKYFTEHPLVPLERIRFLVNVDMVGTGEAGITVVNATLHPREFGWLTAHNERKRYLSKINARGEAANSDHYFFTQKNVPAFFIYTQGGPSAYHDINDVAAKLPLTEYSDLFRLFRDFTKALMEIR